MILGQKLFLIYDFKDVHFFIVRESILMGGIEEVLHIQVM